MRAFLPESKLYVNLFIIIRRRLAQDKFSFQALQKTRGESSFALRNWHHCKVLSKTTLSA